MVAQLLTPWGQILFPCDNPATKMQQKMPLKRSRSVQPTVTTTRNLLNLKKTVTKSPPKHQLRPHEK